MVSHYICYLIDLCSDQDVIASLYAKDILSGERVSQKFHGILGSKKLLPTVKINEFPQLSLLAFLVAMQQPKKSKGTRQTYNRNFKVTWPV